MYINFRPLSYPFIIYPWNWQTFYNYWLGTYLFVFESAFNYLSHMVLLFICSATKYHNFNHLSHMVLLFICCSTKYHTFNYLSHMVLLFICRATKYIIIFSLVCDYLCHYLNKIAFICYVCHKINI